MKSYAKRYEEDDELLLAAAGSEQLERRAHLRKVWEEWISSKEAWLQCQERHLIQVRPLGTRRALHHIHVLSAVLFCVAICHAFRGIVSRRNRIQSLKTDDIEASSCAVHG